MKVFIVMRVEGEYSDRQEFPVAAFERQEDAQAYVDRQVPRHGGIWIKNPEGYEIEHWYVASDPVEVL